MLWVPNKGKLRVETNVGNVGSTTVGTAVTTGGSTTTKGTPAELIASTSFDAYWIVIHASGYGQAATASQGCFDLLVGASTERIIIPDLLMGYCGSPAGHGSSGKAWMFPLYIPAGTRIAAQSAGNRVTTAVNVAIWLYGGNGYPPFRVGQKVTTYGMGTVPNGTTLTPGASGVEDDAWVQMTASTSEDHFAFIPSFQLTGDTTTNNRSIQTDIAIGAATEQQIGSWNWVTGSNEQMDGPNPSMPVFHDVPSGTRLVMRASNSGTNDGGYNGVIHAVS